MVWDTLWLKRLTKEFDNWNTHKRGSISQTKQRRVAGWGPSMNSFRRAVTGYVELLVAANGNTVISLTESGHANHDYCAELASTFHRSHKK